MSLSAEMLGRDHQAPESSLGALMTWTFFCKVTEVSISGTKLVLDFCDLIHPPHSGGSAGLGMGNEWGTTRRSPNTRTDVAIMFIILLTYGPEPSMSDRRGRTPSSHTDHVRAPEGHKSRAVVPTEVWLCVLEQTKFPL